MINPEKNWFGQTRVAPDEKTQKVLGVFESVAENYDIMNDVMSGGLHRVWKDRLIAEIKPRTHYKYLDVAGGTGDIAFRLRKKLGPAANITISDINPEMLEVGKDRAADKGWINDFKWAEANAETLPFNDNSFDIYTIAFGLRNVTHIDTALGEAFRVLKPGGRFFCLEFSDVRNPLLSKAYDFYSYQLIPKMGEVIAKDAGSYQYLVESIRKFPAAKDLQARLTNAGFQNPRYTKMSAGIVAIHRGLKA